MTASKAVNLSSFIKLALSALVIVVLYSIVHAQTAQAACTALPDTYGRATTTVTVPQAGNYRVWSRIMAPNTTANSYYLEVDGSSCGIVVGDSAITANTWTWVDYQGGTSSSKINLNLTAGTHTVVMIGREADVKLDRVILTADTSCVPSGVGENCANPPDTTPPTVSVTAPAANATVSGATTISATATDDVGISKVEFYVGGVLRDTDTSPAYSTSFNMSSLAPGQYDIYARAYDTSNNATSSSLVRVTVADTTAPTVSLTSPTAGATLSGTTTLSANASDNVGVTKVEFYVDGTLRSTDTVSPYTVSFDTTALTNASHSFTARAYDAANNNTNSAAVSATVNNVAAPSDTTAPNVSITNPAAGETIRDTALLSANATDNVGVTRVEFYVDGSLVNTDNSAPYEYSLNTKTLSNAAHSITARAYDAAGNNRTSAAVSVTVSNVTYLAEDINQDGHVNIQDFSLLIGKFGQSGAGLGRADINGDGRVNIQDFSLLIGKFGT